MNAMYEKLAAKWAKGYITRETLRGWVALNEVKPGRGITPEEYKRITGELYTEPAE